MLTALMTFVVFSMPCSTLEVQDTHFSVNGREVFLLGASYYGALGAPDEFVDKDLEELNKLGFNWIRVWGTWSAFDNDVSAVDSKGNIREPYFSKLKRICEKADELGMIVDLTLSRGGRLNKANYLPSYESHLNAVTNLTRELKQYRNLYIDTANERNVRDARFVSFEELKAMKERIKEIDPDRLVTASQGGDISREELEKYLKVAQVDFITPHRPRNARSPSLTLEKTREYLAQMQELGKLVPVLYQEPFRRGYGKWQPDAQAFITDLKNAIRGGAAGWCFHNGDVRNSDGGRPRRSFDMRKSEGRLFDQLDPEEVKVVLQVQKVLKDGFTPTNLSGKN